MKKGELIIDELFIFFLFERNDLKKMFE